MVVKKRYIRLLIVTAWVYLFAVASAAGLLHFESDQWWPASFLLFGPRWMFGVPLLALLPAALFIRRSLLLPLGVAAVIFLWPLLGFNYASGDNDYLFDSRIRVLSCNAGGNAVDEKALSELIRSMDVDVVALQEFPGHLKLDLPDGWSKAQAGALAVYSRVPMEAGEPVLLDHPPHKWKRNSLLPVVITTRLGRVAFHSIHLPSPRYGLQHVLDKKRIINTEKTDLLEAQISQREEAAFFTRKVVNDATLPVIVAGDFNMPRESSLFRRFWGDMQDAFVANSTGYGWTFFERMKGIPVMVGVDHILTSNGVRSAWFQIGPDVGSDHRPIIADVIPDAS
ncbi:endonuclease/exonuclease/phosphatase family protein [Oleidesulfovibrio sp.]|uniref:endonuclease/exonuclease/phosphatase family protein n=1 Tax=Oleidesulfovibrio sp. TaxID=2909707 RepID=UPI003A84C7A9